MGTVHQALVNYKTSISICSGVDRILHWGDLARWRIGFNCIRGDTVTDSHDASAIGRDPFARHDDSDKIQRIGCRDGNRLSSRRIAAHGAQGLYGNRQCELFAQEAVYKSSSTHFAASLKSPQRHQEFSPTRQDRLTRQHLAENDAIAFKKHPASRLNSRITALRFTGIE